MIYGAPLSLFDRISEIYFTSCSVVSFSNFTYYGLLNHRLYVRNDVIARFFSVFTVSSFNWYKVISLNSLFSVGFAGNLGW